MNDSIIIQATNLKKEFSERGKVSVAVADVNLSVSKGEVFGLLGPNGAGKTTTMRILCTLLTPTSGRVLIAGFDSYQDPESIRRSIGYVSQKGGQEPDATGRENLVLQARLYGLEKEQASQKAQELIGLFNLDSFADRKAKTYSGGQRRIFDLACAIIHSPRILFLDEPTTGLDPQSRARVWQEVKNLNRSGTTVFLTTHYLEEADELCSRVAVVDHGLIIAEGAPAALKAQIAHDIIILGMATAGETQRVAEILKNHPAVKEIQITDSTVHIYLGIFKQRDEILPSILKLLHQESMNILSIQLSRPTLDDVFLKLTGRNMRDTHE